MPGVSKPTPQARVYHIAGAKPGASRRRQIVASRSYVYDGFLAPTCLSCGFPRERHMRGLKCSGCEAAA